MDFPVEVKFIPGVGRARMLVTDPAGRPCGCLAGVSGQFKSVVYTDTTQSTPIYGIEWTYKNPVYRFSSADGAPLGSMKRTPWQSVWRAHYVVEVEGAPPLAIVEENPWIKVLDTLAELLPLIGRFNGLFLNPAYLVVRADGNPALRLVKERDFYERRFSVHRTAALAPREQEVAMLALMMFIERENTRG